MEVLKLFVGTCAFTLAFLFLYISSRAFMVGMFVIGFMSALIVIGMGHLSYSMFIDIVGEIPVVLTTGGIALTCKLVRACFFTLASSLVYFTNYLCYNS